MTNLTKAKQQEIDEITLAIRTGFTYIERSIDEYLRYHVHLNTSDINLTGVEVEIEKGFDQIAKEVREGFDRLIESQKCK